MPREETEAKTTPKILPSFAQNCARLCRDKEVKCYQHSWPWSSLELKDQIQGYHMHSCNKCLLRPCCLWLPTGHWSFESFSKGQTGLESLTYVSPSESKWSHSSNAGTEHRRDMTQSSMVVYTCHPSIQYSARLKQEDHKLPTNLDNSVTSKTLFQNWKKILKG